MPLEVEWQRLLPSLRQLYFCVIIEKHGAVYHKIDSTFIAVVITHGIKK